MAKHRKHPSWWVSKLHGEWWAYPTDPTLRSGGQRLDGRFKTHGEAMDYAHYMASMGVGL